MSARFKVCVRLLQTGHREPGHGVVDVALKRGLRGATRGAVWEHTDGELEAYGGQDVVRPALGFGTVAVVRRYLMVLVCALDFLCATISGGINTLINSHAEAV